jgi:hypothetical protein
MRESRTLKPGRISRPQLIGWSVASICMLPITTFLTMMAGTAGAQGVTSVSLAVLQWVVVVLALSPILGPVLALAFWLFGRRRLTWWSLALPYLMIPLTILAVFAALEI